MQALESLNDSQVNDFLSGKTPLNLSMRLGDHMMLIQLQLSTVNPTNSSSSTSTTASTASATGSTNLNHPSRTRGIIRSKTSSSMSTRSTISQSTLSGSHSTNSTPIKFTNVNQLQTPEKYQHQNRNEQHSPQPSTSRMAATSNTTTTTINTTTNRQHISIHNSSSNNQINVQRDSIGLSSEEFDDLRNIVSSLGCMQNIDNNDENRNNSLVNDSDIEMENSLNDALLEQSPIKSLSNLVSGPIKTTPMKNIPMSDSAATTSIMCTDPSKAKITSCLCKTLETSSSTKGCDINCQFLRNRHQQSQQPPQTPTHHQQLSHKKLSAGPSELKSTTRSSTLLHRTLNNPITKLKSTGSNIQPQTVHLHRVGAGNLPNLRRSKSTDNITISEQGIAKMVAAKTLTNDLAVDQPISIIDTTATTVDGIKSQGTLAEASRNLTKTLRKLSKEVFTNKSDMSTFIASDETKRARTSGTSNTATGSNTAGSHQSGSAVGSVTGIGSGAVIESMRNHGRGIYSGTFSGTLNPALQDRYGRPKRDISTVIHILNDLLSATPHYSRGARISFEPAHNSRSSKYVS